MSVSPARLFLSLRRSPLGTLLRRLSHSRVGRALMPRALRGRFGIAAVTGKKPALPRDRGPAPAVDEEELRRDYRARAVSGEGESFVLYRILGNDITPRHRVGQTRENLQFILEHEPALPACEKRFVVNRITDPLEEEEICSLLEDHRAPYLHIPFEPGVYDGQPWDMAGFPEPGYSVTGEFARLPEDFRARLDGRLCRHKNNYLVNNNGARNAALADGRGRAKWILPWDGNCFLTTDAWNEIREAVTLRPWYPYAVVPMARVSDRQALLEPGPRPRADQEPQIVFRRDARESFSEAFYYGRRPKVELLWRLGVPGPWDDWALEPWDLPVPDYAEAAGAWQWAGWVARLPSGQPRLEGGAAAETRRLGVRTEAVTGFLLRQDAVRIRRRLDALDGELLPAELRVDHAVRREQMIRELVSYAGLRRRVSETLLRNRELPFLLHGLSARAAADRRLARIRRWLREDAVARSLRRSSGLDGTIYDLLLLCLHVAVADEQEVSRAFAYVADRATALFGAQGGPSDLLNNYDHRRAWQALHAAARRCGEDIWISATPPANLMVLV